MIHRKCFAVFAFISLLWMFLSDIDKAGYPPCPDKTAPQFISFWMDEVGLMNLMLLCHLMPYEFFGKHIMLDLLSRSFNVLSGFLNTKPIWFAFPTVKVTQHWSILSCWRFPLRHFRSGTIYIFFHSCAWICIFQCKPLSSSGQPWIQFSDFGRLAGPWVWCQILLWKAQERKHAWS